MTTNSSSNCPLQSDTLVHISRMLLAHSDSESEQTYQTLSKLMPELSYHYHLIEGSDYSDLRASLIADGLLSLIDQKPEHYNIPSVLTTLEHKFASKLAQNGLTYATHQQLQKRGFVFTSGPLIDDRLGHFPQVVKERLVEQLKAAIKRELLSNQCVYDKLLLEHPDIINKSSETDTELSGLAYERITNLILEGCQKDFLKDQSNSIRRSEVRKALFENPSIFHNIKPFLHQIHLLDMDKPFPSEGRAEIFIKRTGDDQYVWRRFTITGQKCDNSQYITEQKYPNHHIMFLKTGEEFPTYGQATIFIRPDKSDHYDIKVFDEEYSKSDSLFTNLSQALIEKIDRHLQLENQQNDTKQTLVESTLQEVGSERQRALLNDLFAGTVESDNPNILKTLNRMLVDDASEIEAAADQYLEQLIEWDHQWVKTLLPKREMILHPSRKIAAQTKEKLYSLIENGRYDYELKSSPSDNSWNHSDRLAIKNALLNSPDIDIRAAAIDRVKSQIRDGNLDVALFDTNYNSGSRDKNIFKFFTQIELKKAIAERAIELINTTGVTGQENHLSDDRLINIIEATYHNYRHAELDQLANQKLKPLLTSALQKSGHQGNRGYFNYSPQRDRIFDLLRREDLTRSRDPEIAALSKSLILEMIKRGAVQKNYEPLTQSLYHQHADEEIRSEFNKSLASSLIQRRFKSEFALPYLEGTDDQVRELCIKHLVKAVEESETDDFLHFYLGKDFSHPSDRLEPELLDAYEKRFQKIIQQADQLTDLELMKGLWGGDISEELRLGRANDDLKILANRYADLFDRFETLNNDREFVSQLKHYGKLDSEFIQLGKLSLTPFLFDSPAESIRTSTREFALSYLNQITIKSRQDFSENLTVFNQLCSSPEESDSKQAFVEVYRSKLLNYLQATPGSDGRYVNDYQLEEYLSVLISGSQAVDEIISNEAESLIPDFLKCQQKKLIHADRIGQRYNLFNEPQLESLWTEVVIEGIESGEHDDQLLTRERTRGYRDAFNTALDSRFLHRLESGVYNDQLATLNRSDLVEPSLYAKVLQKAGQLYHQGFYDTEIIERPWECLFEEPVDQERDMRLLELIQSGECDKQLGKPYYIDHPSATINEAVRTRLREITGDHFPQLKPIPSFLSESRSDSIPQTEPSTTARQGDRLIQKTPTQGQAESLDLPNSPYLESLDRIINDFYENDDDYVYEDIDAELIEQQSRYQLNQAVGGDLFTLNDTSVESRFEFSLPLGFLSKKIRELNSLNENDRITVSSDFQGKNIVIRVIRESVDHLVDSPVQGKSFPIGYKIRADIERSLDSFSKSKEGFASSLYRQTLTSLDHLSTHCFHCDSKLASPSLKPLPCSETHHCEALYEQFNYGADFQSIYDNPERFDLILTLFKETAKLDPNRFSLVFSNNWPNSAGGKAFRSDDARVKTILSLLESFPSVDSLPKDQEGFDRFIHQLNRDTKDTIGWMLSRSTHLYNRLSNISNALPTDRVDAYQIASSPEKEAAFQTLKESGSSHVTFHGTDLANAIGIITNGLQNLSDTDQMTNGAVYGSGVYHAEELKTALSYSERALEKRRAPTDIRLVVLCESIESKTSHRVEGMDILVEPEDDHILPRALLFFREKPDTTSMTTPITADDLPTSEHKTYHESVVFQAERAIASKDMAVLNDILPLIPASEQALRQSILDLELNAIKSQLKEPRQFESVIFDVLDKLDSSHPLLGPDGELLNSVLESAMHAYIGSIETAFAEGASPPLDLYVKSFGTLRVLETILAPIIESSTSSAPLSKLINLTHQYKDQVFNQCKALRDPVLAKTVSVINRQFIPLIQQYEFSRAKNLVATILDVSFELNPIRKEQMSAIEQLYQQHLTNQITTLSSSSGVDAHSLLALQTATAHLLKLKESDSEERNVDWMDYSVKLDRLDRTPLRFAYETVLILQELVKPLLIDDKVVIPIRIMAQVFDRLTNREDEMVYFYSPSVLSQLGLSIDNPERYLIPNSVLETLPNRSLYEQVPRLAFHRESEGSIPGQLAAEFANVFANHIHSDQDLRNLVMGGISPEDACAAARQKSLHTYMDAKNLEFLFELVPDIDRHMSINQVADELLRVFRQQSLYNVAEKQTYPSGEPLYPIDELRAGEHVQTILATEQWSEAFTMIKFITTTVEPFLKSEEGRTLLAEMDGVDERIAIERMKKYVNGLHIL